MDHPADALPLEYDSDKARATVVSEFVELVRYRDLLRLLVSRSIKTRYKRSVLGVAWTLLNPLVNMVVMSVAFSALFKTTKPNYPVYLLVGLVVWSFFSQTTAYAMGTLVWGGSLLKRVYIPPTIFAVACVANGLINLTFSLVPLLVVIVFLGHPLHLTWLFLPVSVGVLAVFCLGVSLLVSTLAVFFTDAVDMYQLLLQAWFFLTPIIYPREILLPDYAWLLHVNPMAHFVEIFRAPLYEGQLPDAITAAVCVAWAIVALALGSWVFARKSHELAYTL